MPALEPSLFLTSVCNQAHSGWHKSLFPIPTMTWISVVVFHDFIILPLVFGQSPTPPQSQTHKKLDEKCSVVSLEFLSRTLWLPAWQRSGVSGSLLCVRPGGSGLSQGTNPSAVTWLGCPVLPFTGWGGGWERAKGGSRNSRLAQEAGITVHTSMCCLDDKLRNCVNAAQAHGRQERILKGDFHGWLQEGIWVRLSSFKGSIP